MKPWRLFLIFRPSPADLPNVTVKVCLVRTRHAGEESIPAFRKCKHSSDPSEGTPLVPKLQLGNLAIRGD